MNLTRQQKYNRKRLAERIANGLCIVCGAPNPTGRSTCQTSREAQTKRATIRMSKLIAEGLCSKCGKAPLSDSSKWWCAACLDKHASRMKQLRQSPFGKWEHEARRKTSSVGRGYIKDRRKQYGWSHEDFICQFPDWRGMDDLRVIDHVIPLSCAEMSGGELDQEFSKVVTRLQNLQLLNHSANLLKGHDTDRAILVRSLALRGEGLTGVPLFHRLWDEFSDQAQAHAA